MGIVGSGGHCGVTSTQTLQNIYDAKVLVCFFNFRKCCQDNYNDNRPYFTLVWYLVKLCLQWHFYTWFHGTQDNLVRYTNGVLAKLTGLEVAELESNLFGFLKSGDYTIYNTTAVHIVGAECSLEIKIVAFLCLLIGVFCIVLTYTVTMTCHSLYLCKYVLYQNVTLWHISSVLCPLPLKQPQHIF